MINSLQVPFSVSALDKSDFTLVELDDEISEEFNVYYAGWNATLEDAESAIAIHHPSTDEKTY